ncbi:MAG: ABC transporter permease [Spirochaetota bacterium]
MKAFWRLLKVEFKLVLRSIDVVLFAVLMPVVVMVVIGLIYGRPDEGDGMVQLSMGAFLSIGVAAVGLMGLPLTLAEYRSRKVLKRLSVTPIHPGTLLAVQMIAQAAVCLLSALLVVVAGMLLFGYELQAPLVPVLATYLFVMLSIFSIGLMIASTARDVKRAGMIASLLYFPMLIFSGTTIPFSAFPEIVQRVTVVLPLRHGIEVLSAALNGSPAEGASFVLLAGLALVAIVVSLKTFRWDME